MNPSPIYNPIPPDLPYNWDMRIPSRRPARCGNSMCRQPLPADAAYCSRCGAVRISDSPGRRSTGCLVLLLSAIALATGIVLLWLTR
jgi:hypothetical protein